MCYWYGGPWSGGLSGGWYGGGIVMMLPMLLVLGLLIWGGVLLMRKLSQPAQGNRAVGGTVQEILKERYAKGEISRDEFAQMMKDIQ